MSPGQRDGTGLSRAVPHLVGTYAVAGLLTGAFYYDRVAFVPHDARMTGAFTVGALWPGYWLVRVAKSVARQASPMRNDHAFGRATMYPATSSSTSATPAFP
jgi:hypothetical protein